MAFRIDRVTGRAFVAAGCTAAALHVAPAEKKNTGLLGGRPVSTVARRPPSNPVFGAGYPAGAGGGLLGDRPV